MGTSIIDAVARIQQMSIKCLMFRDVHPGALGRIGPSGQRIRQDRVRVVHSTFFQRGGFVLRLRKVACARVAVAMEDLFERIGKSSKKWHPDKLKSGIRAICS